MGQGSGDIVHRPSPIVHSTFHIPLIAAFLAAIYAYFVLYGAMVQTEALYICALLWSLERALALASSIQHRPSSIAHSTFDIRHATFAISISLGLSLGVATLLRQSILPWVVVLCAWLLWRAVHGSVGPNSCNSWQTSVASLFIAGLALLACIAPFTLRNYRVYGSFLLLNSNAGYAMYSAQHPDHGTSFREYWAAPLPADIDPATMNEATWDKELMRRGIGFVLADPGRYVLLSLSRVRDYIEFWPTADSSLLFNIGRVASIGVFLPFMLYGVWLEVKAKVKTKTGGGYFSAPALTLTLAFVLFYSALHIATWAMSRYRLPADAVLLLFAGLAIAQLAERWRGKGQGSGVRAQASGLK